MELTSKDVLCMIPASAAQFQSLVLACLYAAWECQALKSKENYLYVAVQVSNFWIQSLGANGCCALPHFTWVQITIASCFVASSIC